MTEIPKTLIFLGPQGSGKDTQARLLSEKFGYTVFDTGNLLREIAKEKSDLGKKVKATIDAGNLVEPELATDVINSQLEKIDAEQTVIVSGYPRGRKQYELLKQTWPDLGKADFLVIYIDITDEEAIRRILSRAEKEGRVDDTTEAIKKRLQWSRSKVDPVVYEMEEESRLIRINGMPGIEEVHQEILDKLKLGDDE